MTALRRVAMISILAACGGAPRREPVEPAASNSPTDSPSTVAFQPGAEATPETICARIVELMAGQCEVTAGYTLSESECRDEMSRALETRGDASRSATLATARCLLDNAACDAVGACLEETNTYADEQDGTPTQFRECSQTDVYAPVGVSQAEFDQRPGATATRYSDVATTKETPLEVCGIPAQVEWIAAATCNDGSHPFVDFDHAHTARVGNVGPGGRCGSIVDLYAVACPEGSYQIYIDSYVCPLPGA